MSQRLMELLAKVEGAAEGSGRLDREFWCLINGYDSIVVDNDPWARYYAHKIEANGKAKSLELSENDIAPVSQSIDAAVALFDKLLPTKLLRLTNEHQGYWKCQAALSSCKARPTAPLAILGSLLTALLAQDAGRSALAALKGGVEP